MGTASPLEATGADVVAIEVNARIRMRRLVSNGALNLGYVESVDGADVLVRLDRGPRIVVPASTIKDEKRLQTVRKSLAQCLNPSWPRVMY